MRHVNMRPDKAQGILDAYFRANPSKYPNYREAKNTRAHGAPYWSRKALAASGAPGKLTFFNGAPSATAGNYEKDGMLSQKAYIAVLGVCIKVLPVAVTAFLDFLKMSMAGVVSIKIGDEKDVWKQVPLHEVLDAPHGTFLSNITVAATEQVYLPGGVGEDRHSAFFLLGPGEKVEVTLEWDTSVFTAVGTYASTSFDCLLDYVAKV